MLDIFGLVEGQSDRQKLCIFMLVVPVIQADACAEKMVILGHPYVRAQGRRVYWTLAMLAAVYGGTLDYAMAAGAKNGLALALALALGCGRPLSRLVSGRPLSRLVNELDQRLELEEEAKLQVRLVGSRHHRGVVSIRPKDSSGTRHLAR